MSDYRDRHIGQEDSNFNGLFSVLSALVVIVLLNGISLPIYFTYIQKTRLSEMQMIFGDIRTQFQIFYGVHGRIPDLREGTDLLNEIDYIYSANKAKIADARYDPAIGFYFQFESNQTQVDGKILQFSPVVDENKGSILWLCGYSAQIGAITPIRKVTTIAEQYLPASCKNI